MRHLITPTRRLLRRVLVTILVLVALVNVAAFLLTPLLDRYHDELAAAASERLGVPITVARLDARWRGFGPELVLHDLHIGDPAGGKGLQLSEAAVDFGFWDMIRHLDLSPLRVSLRDLEVKLVRRPDGRVELAGFENGGLVGNGGDPLPFGGRLRLEDATVLWEDQRLGLPEQRLEQTQLRLHLWPDRMSLTASVKLPGEPAGQLRLGARLQLAQDDWSGEIYLAGHAPTLGQLIAPYLPAPLVLARGGADFELWTDWQASRLVSSEGHLRLRDLHLQRGDDPALDLELAETDFRYRRQKDQLSLDLAELRLVRDGHQWPRSDLHLSLGLDPDAHPVSLNLSADYLRLADLAAFSRPWPLPADLTAMRDGLQLDGELFDLRLALKNTPDTASAVPDWQLSTGFTGLRSTAWGDYPGVSGINGHARGDSRQLRIRVDAGDSALDWPALLRSPLPVTRLSGELDWETQPDGSHALSSRGLIVDTPDIGSISRLRLNLPVDGPMDIDLHSELRDGDGRHTARYLPTRHMSAPLVTWLDSAITSGHVPQGTLLLRGPLRDFPFHKTHNGRFEVRFDVTDMNLQYQAGWPPLQIDDAEVVFNNNALDITLRRGRVYDTQLDGTTARIASLEPISPLLLRGQAAGPLKDLLGFIANSPLQARFGDLASAVTVKGRSRLTLDMAVALDDPHKDRLSGKLQLLGDTLTLPAQQLTLSQAKGSLSFDLDSVRGEQLQAVALGRPVRIDVTPVGDKHRITAQTRLTDATLRQRLPALPKDLISGEAGLTLTLDIPNQRDSGQSPWLSLSSDLQGMALALPAPLGKPADSARPLRISLPLGDDDPLIRVRYDERLDAVFRSSGRRIGVRFGGETAELPDSESIRLDGRLGSLSLDPWLALIEQPDAAAQGQTWPPLEADLQLAQLKLGRAAIDDVHVQLARRDDGWQGSADSARFSGRFIVPPKGSTAPLQLDLSRLSIDLGGAETGDDAPAPDAGKPTDWPAMDLEVASLQINGHGFGRLQIQARHENGQLKLQPLTLDGPLASFDGMMLWRGEGQRADTDLVGTLKTPALGKLLTALGYSPQFERAPGSAELSLGWPGNPGAAGIAALRGQVKLAIGQGQLLELEPGVARAFGLLNFGAVQRRLRLDFSDLFGKGMSFDKITGDFRLIDGNAYTSNLNITGPSADITITGRTGLVNRDLYQQVTVVPSFDATLPIAGTLAGGPLAGVAVLVAQTVMRDKVDKFNRIQYSVTGTWDEPKVERIGGGGLSKVLSPITDLFDRKPDNDQEKTGPDDTQ